MTVREHRHRAWLSRVEVQLAIEALEAWAKGTMDPLVCDTLNEIGPASDLLKELLRAAAKGEHAPRWVQSKLRGRFPERQVEDMARLMVFDFIERMTRPPGTRRLCYN